MINVDPLYAYILLIIPFAIIWMIMFFIGGSESKREQIAMSSVGLILGPVTEILYFKDYWMPQSIFSFNTGFHSILLEDLLFGFLFGGIVAVLYTSFFQKTSQVEYDFRHLAPLIIFSALAAAFTLVLLFLGVNSIFATTAGFVTVVVMSLVLRTDLYKCALWSGFLTSTMLFFVYFIGFNFVSNSDAILQQIWLLSDTNLGLRLLKVPVSELIWGFGAGMMVGIIYKVASGKRIYSKK